MCRETWNLGVSALPIKADVSVESEVESMVEEAMTVFGKIDVLVNNAGVLGSTDLIINVSKEAWDEVIDVNLNGMFLCSKAVLRHMIRQRSGNIINISSGAGRAVSGRVRSLPYAVSKFGVEGITYALAAQMKPYGICVNAIRPGWMATDIIKGLPLPNDVVIRHPDEVKELALFLALQTVDTMTGESINLGEWERGPQAI